MLKNYYVLWNTFSSMRKWQALWLVVIICTSSALEVLSLGIVIPFLTLLFSPETFSDFKSLDYLNDIFNVSSQGDTVLLITGAFITCFIIAAFFKLLLYRWVLIISYSIGSEIASQAFERAMMQPYEMHKMNDTSDLVATVSIKAAYLISNTLYPLLMVISSSLILFSLVIFLVLIQPAFTISAALALCSTYVLILMLSKRSLYRHGAIVSNNNSEVVRLIQYGSFLIKDLILNANVKNHVENFKTIDLRLKKSQASIKIISVVPRYFIECVAIVLFATFGAYLAYHSEMPSNFLPIFGAFALAAQKILPLFQQIYQNISILRGDQSSLIDLLNVLKIKTLREQIEFDKTIGFKDEISFHNVCYKYPGSKTSTLNHVTISLKKGSKIGVIGHSGSGKSTFIDLLMGLLTPTSGKIEIDGVELNQSNIRSWQSKISHAPQTIILLDDLIENNIIDGFENVSKDSQKLCEVLSDTLLTEVNQEISKSNTHKTVGEFGGRLSGGQRQRVGLAKALYKNKDIIVLDEATSALDHETEMQVLTNLYARERQKTIITIAHKLESLQHCDVVLEFEKGKLINVSNYSNLAESKKMLGYGRE